MNTNEDCDRTKVTKAVLRFNKEIERQEAFQARNGVFGDGVSSRELSCNRLGIFRYDSAWRTIVLEKPGKMFEN